MSDPAIWGQVGKWIVAACSKYVPKWILKRSWPPARLLTAVEVFHFNQAPRFYIRGERGQAELEYVGFNVFNLSPFDLKLVGADLEVIIDSQTWLNYEMRLSSETLLSPYARGGLIFKRVLSPDQVSKLQTRTDNWLQMRVRGHIVLQSPVYGELKKDIHADVVALIDRDQ